MVRGWGAVVMAREAVGRGSVAAVRGSVAVARGWVPRAAVGEGRDSPEVGMGLV